MRPTTGMMLALSAALAWSVNEGMSAPRGKGGGGRPGAGPNVGSRPDAGRAGARDAGPPTPRTNGPADRPAANNAKGALDTRAGAAPRSENRPGAGNLQEHLGLADPASSVGNAQQRATGLAETYGSAHPPFSPAWYAEHPNAFKVTHPHADAAAAAATTAGLAAWLAVATVPASGSAAVVVTESAPASQSADSSTPNDLPPASETSTNPGAAATEAGDWMEIGVYALAANAESEPTRMIQLAVDRNGALRGSYVDLPSQEVQSVQGQVDKKTLDVQWTVGERGQVVFHAVLGDLTLARSKVTAVSPNGKRNDWQLIQRKP